MIAKDFLAINIFIVNPMILSQYYIPEFVNGLHVEKNRIMGYKLKQLIANT